MGTLYDYAYMTVAQPISSFVIEWDLGENREGVARRRRVKMQTRYTMQCQGGMLPDVGPEFRSEAFEDLEVKFGEEKMTT